jgi:hypothetical protein
MEPKIDLSAVTFDWKSENDQISGYESTDTITLSSTDYNTTVIGGGPGLPPGGGFSVPNGSINGSNTYPYTVSATSSPFTIGTTGTSNPWSFNSSTTLRLNGDGADIEVNGWSLVDAVKQIEERLNILQPNTKLESEWAELRELGQKYRELEQHIKDKQATWDRLKAMPPPNIE